MYVLYRIHRCRICSTWYEWPRGHDYYRILICTMQHAREGRSLKKCLSPDVHESTLRGDVVQSLTRPYNGMKSAVMGGSLHPLLLWEWPELLIDLFPMMRVNTRFRQGPCLCWGGTEATSREDASRPSAHPNMKGTDQEEIMISFTSNSPTDYRRCGLGHRLMHFKEKGR